MNIADSKQFTKHFLSQFHSINCQSIESLIENGYRNREELMAFDLIEDLPLLRNVNMAQKSLIRKALKLLISDEEFGKSLKDIKAINVAKLKRKNNVIESAISAKRSRKTDSILPNYNCTRLSGRCYSTASTVTLNPTPSQLPTETDEEAGKVVLNQLSQNLSKRNPKISAKIKTELNDVKVRKQSICTSMVSPTTTRKMTTPMSKFDKGANNVPTQTEIELREHLTEQKVLVRTRRNIRK